MVAEIRKLGKHLALYTEEVPVYTYLNKKLVPSQKIPYLQNGKPVGFDLYYDARMSRTIRQVIRGQLLLGI